MKKYFTARKRVITYFKAHVEYNAVVHFLAGIGLGILIASPIAFPHPVRWALVFVGLSILGHFFALLNSKK